VTCTYSRSPDVRLDPPPPNLPTPKVYLRTDTAIALSPIGAGHEDGRPGQSLLIAMLNEPNLDVILLFRCKGVGQQSVRSIISDGKCGRLVGRVVRQSVESVVECLCFVLADTGDW
jgi:hypothetical protein